jgi:hypothetical protein
LSVRAVVGALGALLKPPCMHAATIHVTAHIGVAAA